MNGWNACPRSSQVPRVHQTSGVSYWSLTHEPEAVARVSGVASHWALPAVCQWLRRSCSR
jgi:hypothetical protein